MTVNIIQWNINSLIKKKNDLQIINKYNSIAKLNPYEDKTMKNKLA